MAISDTEEIVLARIDQLDDAINTLLELRERELNTLIEATKSLKETIKSKKAVPQ